MTSTPEGRSSALADAGSRRETPHRPTSELVDETEFVWLELGRRFAWYDSAASASRWCYQLMKIAALATGAAVTVLAAIRAPAALTASLAAAVVLLEGAQQVFQFHANWISYRATAETLREHRFLYAARVAPYDDVATRQAALAAFLRDLTTTENGTWSKTMSQTPPVASSSS